MMWGDKEPDDKAYTRFKDEEKLRRALATRERWRAMKGTVSALAFIAFIFLGTPAVREAIKEAISAGHSLWIKR